jgi:hypothetical protein
MANKEQIEASILVAEKGISKLTKEVIDSVGGYTSPAIRHLLNNLGVYAESYLEIGVHRGATFTSALYLNHHIKRKVGIDNLSEFNEDNSVLVDFFRNANRFVDDYIFINKDCFAITQKDLGCKPDLYLYDGNHSLESHEKALTYFYDMLPDEFTFLVDDSNWEDVRKGTEIGLAKTNLEILYENYLTDGRWHNGLSVYLLKKRA